MLHFPLGGSGGVGPGGAEGAAAGLEEPGEAPARRIEIVGPHLRIVGRIDLDTHRRVTDVVNEQGGLIRLTDAKVTLGDGAPADLVHGDLWVSPAEMTVVAETDTRRDVRSRDDLRLTKAATALAIVTPGHTITGQVHMVTDASLEVFLQSTEPPFLPMTDVRVRSLFDRKDEVEYPFALVNRRHIVAAGPTPGIPQPSSTSVSDRLR